MASLAIQIVDGSGDANATIAVQFQDPDTQTPGGRITLRQLSDALTDISTIVGSPDIQATGRLHLPAHADPFALGGLTVSLAGMLDVTESTIDYSLVTDVTGVLLPGLTIEDRSPGNPSRISMTSGGGLTLDARARAFGVNLSLAGQLHATDQFSLAATADAFDLGGASVQLVGTVFRDAAGLDWGLSAVVNGWQPLPFVTVDSLTVGLNAAGIRFDTAADLAGFNDMHMAGDFRYDDKTYQITADAFVDWTPVDQVHLTDVLFQVTNRNRDDTAGDVRVTAEAHLSLYGTSFLVAASVTSLGSWIAATPAEPWSPIPGLQLDYQFVVASSYDFVIQIDSQGNDVHLSEVPSPPDPLLPNQRMVNHGISLVASSHLPEGIPAIGGSEVQIAGVLGTSLSSMFIEAKIALRTRGS